MKKSIYLLVGFLISFGATAQEFTPTTPLKESNKITKGVLPNGLTYYIYSTPVNKNTASYYIIQNVGSILENDDQKGLAHFLEHMAFNGTKNFPDKAILNTMQTHGAVFGRNINAYTSIDETVYNLDNIPTNVPGLVDTCLLILHDWADELSLEEEEIDAERGVITEEWRTRNDGGQRIYDLLTPIYYNNSKYAERSPIGTMEVVQNFKYKAVRDFYHDWYRTDLQAIVVVGDINAQEVEAKIKSLFSKIPAIKNPRERFEVSIADNIEPNFKVAVDKEVTNSTITMLVTQNEKIKYNTFVDLQTKIENDLANSILNARLKELTLSQNAPFKDAVVGFDKLLRTNMALSMDIMPKPNLQKEAFETVITEYVRAEKFGFSEGEIERAIAAKKTAYENAIERENEKSHAAIIEIAKSNYLEGKVMRDVSAEYEMAKAIFSKVDSKSLQQRLNDNYTAKNRAIAVTGVIGENNITREEALKILADTENSTTLEAYVDSFAGRTLLENEVVKPGKIKKEKKNKEIGSTTFTLSNGVVVHYKFADKNKSEVLVTAESYGGSSLYQPKDFPSLRQTAALAQMSGIADFSSSELKKLLAGKTVQTRTSIGSINEKIEGYSTAKDFETLLKVIRLQFTAPRFDAAMFDLMKNNLENALVARAENLNAKMGDSLSNAMYGKNNPNIRMMNQAYIDDLSFERMQQIYKERFANVADFQFYIVGDVSADAVKPLLEKYIAGIPTTKSRETFKDNTVAWQSSKIDKDVFLPMENAKSTVIIQFEDKLKFDQKNKLMGKMLADVLSLRYMATLREQEGGTYGASTGFTLENRPQESGKLFISFECDSEKVESLLPIVYQEIEKIKAGIIIDEDIEKTKNNYFKSREDSKSYNGYSYDVLYNYYIDGYNMNDPMTYENIVKSITKADLQNFAKEYFDGSKSSEVVFKPTK